MSVGARIVKARFRGCLLGSAVGDALGAPVEFIDREKILERYGPLGITGFEPWRNGAGITMRPGSVTDDTQMTLATALGLLDAAEEFRRTRILDVADSVWARYRAWGDEQSAPEARRYPGETCLSAVRDGVPGSAEEPLNDSKGCGGVMRVAPVGLALAPERAFEAGIEVAALTHGHPTGYLAAGFLADVVSRLARGPRGEHEHQAQRGGPIPAAIADAREVLLAFDDAEETLGAVDFAVELYLAHADLQDAYARLGEGWIAEEALAIGLFSALSFPGDFEQGVLAAVNISGDSDSTGAITGAILGAALGIDVLPPQWAAGVEAAEEIVRIADALYDGYLADVDLVQP